MRYKYRGIVKCKICGREFEPWSGNQVCCSKECAKENNRRSVKASALALKDENKDSQKQAEPSAKKPTIAEIERMANAAGKTYGKYVLEHGL